jgi:beta-glucosidase
MSGAVTAACAPVATALAATWNVDLVEQVGGLLAEEARSKGAHVLLAPTVNLHRSPLAGRNFECFSEDPELSARMAVAFVRGVQSGGVGCAVKHLVCNDSEFERHTISSEVAERALREIYLPPFEAAVREAGAWWVMAAYNRLNGTYCSEHPELLGRILRGEWGFEGVVVSDWFGTRSTAAALDAGLDLEMPGPTQWRGEKLVEAVRKGDVSSEALDGAVGRLLATLERAGRFEDPGEPTERAQDLPAHRRLLRRAAGEAIVLLRNDGALLPLELHRLKRLAVIGPNAALPAIHGGGSSRVAAHYEISPLAGIRARCGDGVEVVFEPGCTRHRTLPGLDARLLREPEGFALEFFAGFELDGAPVQSRRARRLDFTWLGGFSEKLDPERFSLRVTGTLVPERSAPHVFGLTSAGRSRLFVDGKLVLDAWEPGPRGDAFFGMGSVEKTAELVLEAGRPVEIRAEYSKEGSPVLGGLRVGMAAALPADSLERAASAAARADAAIVVVGLDADWETEGRDRVDLELPGRQAELIEKVAAANPNTVVVMNCGAPVRADWVDRVGAALCLWYPGQECGHALADVLFGDVNPAGRLPQTWPRRLEDHPAYLNYPGEHGRVAYGEGIFAGYRYYEKKRIAPRFAFGHGLSYTRFRYGELSVARPRLAAGEAVEASLDVTNAGEKRGQEVVQLYLRDVAAKVSVPEKALAAFHKLELGPGETRRVAFRIEPRALAHWDPTARAWVAEPGTFELLAGASSRDIRTRARFELA